MPTYITLWNYTEDGIANVDDSPDRLDAAKDLIATLGGEMKAFYLTMGEYDLVSVVELPDDDAAGKVLLRIAQGGAVRGTTMKAWPEADYRDLIANLP